MDWGKGIVLTITVFVALIMTMVIISVRMDGIELVTENYYEEEINYQSRIDQSNSANNLKREIISYDSQSKNIELTLPNGTKGSLELFRPSDSSLDQVIDLNISHEGKTNVSLNQLKPGFWTVKLKWSEKGKMYYQEEKITI